MDLERLAGWFRRFADLDAARLPLYRALSTTIAGDPSILELLATARPGQARPVLFLAVLHDLVLRHPDSDLAGHYPTVAGDLAVVADPSAALHAFVDEHRDRLVALLAERTTQTNEVNRSCLWQVMARAAAADTDGRDLAVIEVGASAGLNLWFDRWSVTVGDRELGDPGSSVRLRCGVVGHPPLDRPLPAIAWRRGLDVAPIDLDDPDAVRWLKACIWAEERDRHERFDAAVAWCRSRPEHRAAETIVADDAVDGIGELLDDAPPDTHVLVLGSWVLTYLARDRRDAFAHLLDLAGSDRCLTWVTAEGPGVAPGVEVPAVRRDTPTDASPTIVGMTRWRDGRRHDSVPARCHPQLRWLEWLD